MLWEQISGNNVTYLQQDQEGSTRLLTNSLGTVVGTYTYDPYGETTAHTGVAITPLQYEGQHEDAETGFICLRARYYDPSTEQFLTRDPFTILTASPYGYASSNPLNEDDPLGLFGFRASCLIKDAAIGVAAVAVGAAVVALAPEVAVGTIVTVSVEETSAILVTDAGAALLVTTVVTVAETAITSSDIAEVLGVTATRAGLAVGVAKSFSDCGSGFLSTCKAALAELGTDFALEPVVENILSSPAYELANSLR